MDSFSQEYRNKIEPFETYNESIVTPVNQQCDIVQTVNTQVSTQDIQVQTQLSYNKLTVRQQQQAQRTHQLTLTEANGEQKTTSVRLPALLDGEYFTVTRVEDTNVTARCQQCKKQLNGNLKSTGNFLSHVKRLHPNLMSKIRCKSGQRKNAIYFGSTFNPDKDKDDDDDDDDDDDYDDDANVPVPEKRVQRKRRCKMSNTQKESTNEEPAETENLLYEQSAEPKNPSCEQSMETKNLPYEQSAETKNLPHEQSANWNADVSLINRESEEPEPTDPESISGRDISLRVSHNNSFMMEDEFDAVGRNVAAKLRNMRLDQRIIAEKLLNDILFEAQLCNLRRDSSIHV